MKLYDHAALTACDQVYGEVGLNKNHHSVHLDFSSAHLCLFLVVPLLHASIFSLSVSPFTLYSHLHDHPTFHLIWSLYLVYHIWVGGWMARIGTCMLFLILSSLCRLLFCELYIYYIYHHNNLS